MTDRRLGREIAAQEKRMDHVNAMIEAKYRRVVRKLLRITVELETIGENEVDVLSRRMAGRFHTITDRVRAFTVELTQDVAWPHEPGIPGTEET